MPIHPRGKGLHDYLKINGRTRSDFNSDVLGIFSKDVLRKIKACEEGTWEESVPKGVAEIIKKKRLFDSFLVLFKYNEKNTTNFYFFLDSCFLKKIKQKQVKNLS